MRPELHIHETTEALIAAAGKAIIALTQQVQRSERNFRLALAGGSTPRALYEHLAHKEIASQIDWKAIDVFWGDERCVPPDDTQSNYHMAHEALMKHVPIPPANIHRMQGEIEPEAAAHAYEQELGNQPLDLVLLGMGGDGHTASLFPDTPDLTSEKRRVITTRSPLPPPQRISLTLRTLNAASAVIFLITGESKAKRLAQILSQIEHRKPDLPAAHVQPTNGTLTWYLDSAAAPATRGDDPCISCVDAPLR